MITGSSRAICSSASTRAARAVLDSAPTSTTLAPWAIWTRALRIAEVVETATLSRYVESRERFRVPMITGSLSPTITSPSRAGVTGSAASLAYVACSAARSAKESTSSSR